MIIIGEKINGSIPSVAKAIAERDSESIKALAVAQTEAGADYIDVCASVKDNEVEVLHWLIDQVQSVTDLPICIDSPDPRACIEAIPFCNKVGIINSVSMEGDKIDVVFPAIADTSWQVIALLCEKGIPSTAEERLKIFTNIMTRAKEYGIDPSRIHVDPLVEMLCTSEDGVNMILSVMKEIKNQYPDIHVTGAVSNVSFNLPVRKILNQSFLVLAMNAGLDSAVLDPTNRDLTGLIYATEAMLGIDEYCTGYIGAYRRNLFGPIRTQ